MPVTQEVTSVLDSSPFGRMFRPTFRTYGSIGAWVKGALQAYPEDAVISMLFSLDGADTVHSCRLHTAAGLTAIRAQLSLDYSTNLNSQFVAASGNTSTRQFTAQDQGGTIVLPDNYTIDGLIDSFIDGDLQSTLQTAGLNRPILSLGSGWMIVDLASQYVWWGNSLGASLQADLDGDVPNIEVVLRKKPNAYGFV